MALPSALAFEAVVSIAFFSVMAVAVPAVVSVAVVLAAASLVCEEGVDLVVSQGAVAISVNSLLAVFFEQLGLLVFGDRLGRSLTVAVLILGPGGARHEYQDDRRQYKGEVSSLHHCVSSVSGESGPLSL
jgi:hypothetical protein